MHVTVQMWLWHAYMCVWLHMWTCIHVYECQRTTWYVPQKPRTLFYEAVSLTGLERINSLVIPKSSAVCTSSTRTAHSDFLLAYKGLNSGSQTCTARTLTEPSSQLPWLLVLVAVVRGFLSHSSPGRGWLRTLTFRTGECGFCPKTLTSCKPGQDILMSQSLSCFRVWKSGR